MIFVQGKGLSGSVLKVIALVSMTVDHIAYYLMVHGTLQYDLMRTVGRMAFPIFAFLLVEGYVHTRSVRKYAVNLFVFALVSDIPWWLLNHDNTHNVFFTLLLGLVAMAVVERFKTTTWIQCFAVGILAFIATWLHTDYEWQGVFLIAFFYLFRGRWSLMAMFTIPVMAEYGLLGYLMALALLVSYNGERGFIKGQYAKYGVYAYYPVHLCIIVATNYLT